MVIYFSGHNFTTELERLYGLFRPDEKVRFVNLDEEKDTVKDIVSENGKPENIESASVIRIKQPDESADIITEFEADGKKYRNERHITAEEDNDRYSREIALADGLYRLLCEHYRMSPPWGMLTGVRPVKLLRMLSEEPGGKAPEDVFVKDFHCSESKYRLALETMKHEEKILSLSGDNSFSLYISIPFCPTRCSYCSFVSQSVEKSFRLMPRYVELLIEEIKETTNIVKELGLRLETVYMGGGTPTTLSAEQLADILGAVNGGFDMSTVREITVEAGRPDTVTKEKLAAIKAAGAGRISINPQTMSDEVLKNIGRKHTVAQVYEAMDMARQTGFDCINMDIIAGLTGDTPDGFAATLDAVLALEPENITVHTLAMKRASRLVTHNEASADAQGEAVGKMLDMCSKRLPASGYHPYYLYRQSHMYGNLENVGWAKEGTDGLYNVFIMDETHTILAVGAGGVTKLRQPRVNNIERIYNYKFPYEYIERFENIIDRKKRVKEFYAEFC